MKTSRLEAFSDGVLAIIITIMVLEMEPPKTFTLNALKPIFPVFVSYVLSYMYVGIYWNNHHHLFQIVEKVNGKVLWANLLLLFSLSLLPFATAWIGENIEEKLPMMLYGFILLAAAISFKILVHTIIHTEGENSNLTKVYQNDKRLLISIGGYLLGIGASYFLPIVGLFIYLGVGFMWLIPDKRIEKALEK